MMILRVLGFVLAMALAGCGVSHPEGPPPATAVEVADLEAAFLALDPNVDPAEAAEAAQLTYDTVFALAQSYEITDTALMHNTKVNLGQKPRGLCWHWSVDLGKTLEEAGFQTLDVHYAIANAFNFRLEHSTTLISAAGAPMEDAIVLDPWRHSGVLFWAPVEDDFRYNWMPRQEVWEEQRRREEAAAR